MIFTDNSVSTQNYFCIDYTNSMIERLLRSLTVMLGILIDFLFFLYVEVDRFGPILCHRNVQNICELFRNDFVHSALKSISLKGWFMFRVNVDYSANFLTPCNFITLLQEFFIHINRILFFNRITIAKLSNCLFFL